MFGDFLSCVFSMEGGHFLFRTFLCCSLLDFLYFSWRFLFNFIKILCPAFPVEVKKNRILRKKFILKNEIFKRKKIIFKACYPQSTHGFHKKDSVNLVQSFGQLAIYIYLYMRAKSFLI